MTQKTWIPLLVASFPIFDKIDSFPKKIWTPLANCIFEELSNLYFIVLLTSFFSPILWITAENRNKLKKFFIWNTKLVGTQRYKQKNFIWLSSATEIMLVILWTESDFCIISDCSNSINNKLKNFFNPVDHSLHQKNILRKNVKCLLACASYSHTEFMSWHRRIQNHVKYSKLKLFTKIVNGWKFWIIFTKRSIFDIS